MDFATNGRILISIHVPRVEDDVYRAAETTTHRHFNPRPPCGGRLHLNRIIVLLMAISIHVPRVEDDQREVKPYEKAESISIHVPRVEDDPTGFCQRTRLSDFNPRPPCGGRPTRLSKISRKENISIHVPRVEDDRIGEATQGLVMHISIHVPRVEDDI